MKSGRNIRILVAEQDIYALQAIVGYLGWDRRTTVIGGARSIAQVSQALRGGAGADVLLLDAGLAGSANLLSHLIHEVVSSGPAAPAVVCLGRAPDTYMARACLEAGARAYLVREAVGPSIAHAVDFVLDYVFTVTPDVYPLLLPHLNGKASWVAVLPERRVHSRLTERVDQALRLCVVEGMPAELAAQEMGVSVSTVRSYIKEGYRILESCDETLYPDYVSPVERAFLRYTALSSAAPLSDARPASVMVCPA
ncbi:MAG: response regulator transcription factor [Anaerolineae bacterium]|nr:response regulator transcription factor [Anaerolineae bacterium]